MENSIWSYVWGYVQFIYQIIIVLKFYVWFCEDTLINTNQARLQASLSIVFFYFFFIFLKIFNCFKGSDSIPLLFLNNIYLNIHDSNYMSKIPLSFSNFFYNSCPSFYTFWDSLFLFQQNVWIIFLFIHYLNSWYTPRILHSLSK